MPEPGSQQNQQSTQPSGANVNERRAAAALDRERNQERMNQRGSKPVEDVEGSTTINQTGGNTDISGDQENTNINERSREKEKRNKTRQKNFKQTKSVKKQRGEIKSIASKSNQKEEQEGLRLYPFPMLYLAITLDILDVVSGILDEFIVTAILRIGIEFLVSASIWVMLIPQSSKEDRDQAKYILSALVDIIPILTLLPWETLVLYMINRRKKGGGGFTEKAAQKLGKQPT